MRSEKVLITNLANYIQPFIRYELTDRVIVHNKPCRCGKTTHWLEIEGRYETLDGSHPTAKGHNTIADAWIKSLAESGIFEAL